MTLTPNLIPLLGTVAVWIFMLWAMFRVTQSLAKISRTLEDIRDVLRRSRDLRVSTDPGVD